MRGAMVGGRTYLRLIGVDSQPDPADKYTTYKTASQNLTPCIRASAFGAAGAPAAVLADDLRVFRQVGVLTSGSITASDLALGSL